MKSYSQFIAALLLVATPILAGEGPYEIPVLDVNGGGRESTGGVYELTATSAKSTPKLIRAVSTTPSTTARINHPSSAGQSEPPV